MNKEKLLRLLRAAYGMSGRALKAKDCVKHRRTLAQIDSLLLDCIDAAEESE